MCLAIVLLLKAFLAREVRHLAYLKNDGSCCDVAAVSTKPRFSQYPTAVASIHYNDLINTTGWSFLDIETNGDFSNSQQAAAAGYLEGHATQTRMWQSRVNNKLGDTSDAINEFIDENVAWLVGQVAANADDTYWHHVGLLLAQVRGLTSGYQNVASNDQYLELRDVLLFSFHGDIETLEVIFDEDVVAKTAENFMFKQHCSALIKMLPDMSDIFISHDTWTSFNSMVRVYKKYTFNFKMDPNGNDLIPATTMTFSSYPGSIYSGDDFYQMSSGLVVQETTNGNNNTNLWKFVTTETVPEAFRNVLANRLAVDGRSWTNWFKKFNSGTYNNQWMILDYNKFAPGKIPSKDLLWVLEQIPGFTHEEDVTSVLTDNLFWPSFNIPYFQDIYNLSGFNYSLETFGDFFSHENSSRAKIFARDHVKVKDLKSMQYMMRYADFTKDPLSECKCDPPYSSENTIATRGDLNPADGTWEISAQAQRNHVSSDAKITNYQLQKELKTSAISGPTTQDDNPVFVWSKSPYADEPHLGQPDVWDFDFVSVEWE